MQLPQFTDLSQLSWFDIRTTSLDHHYLNCLSGCTKFLLSCSGPAVDCTCGYKYSIGTLVPVNTRSKQLQNFHCWIYLLLWTLRSFSCTEVIIVSNTTCRQHNWQLKKKKSSPYTLYTCPAFAKIWQPFYFRIV